MTAYTLASITALVAATGTYTPEQVKAFERKTAALQGINLERWVAQVGVETGNTHRADIVTPIGNGHYAYGPSQLNSQFTPPDDVSVRPYDNLLIGAGMMRNLLDKYDYPHALVGYCMGETAMNGIVARAKKAGVDWRTLLSKDVNAYIDRVMAVGGEETPMTSGWKLNLHLIGIPDWARELAGEWVKVLNGPNDVASLFPKSKVIARYYGPGDWNAKEKEWIKNRDWLGYLDACEKFYREHPGVYAFEGPNEPPVANMEELKNLNYFLTCWAGRMRQQGYRTVGGNLSVGWPDLKLDIIALVEAVQECDYWGLHEYWRWPMRDWMPYRPTRYRDWVLAPLAQIGIKPSVLITECGITCAIVPGWPDEGWQTDGIKQGQYWDSLVEYNAELCQDDQVLAAFVFTSGSGAAFQDWDTFEVNRDLARLMKRAQQANPNPVPVPTPAPVDILPMIREAACAQIGRPVPYNPDTALAKFARANNLGGPMTPEYDVGAFRAQGYAMQIVYCPRTDWSKVEKLTW